jgi:hypothetical protein
VIYARGVGNLYPELARLGEIYLVETYSILADYLGSRRCRLKNTRIEVILATQKAIESVTISDMR